MAFNAVTVLLLISAPGDVPTEDMATVRRVVSQWNWNTGRPSGVTVIPVSWSEHAVAEFGDRPQGIINEQLVDDSDMALALFADRLGTPTGRAESGTMEEIDRLVEAGKHVSVLVNQAPRSLTGKTAIEEKGRLEDALIGLRKRAIVLPYVDQATLAGHLNNMLSMAAGRAAAVVPSVERQAGESEAVGVWPHVVGESYQEADSKGRLKTKRRRFVELRNETGRPVFDVSFTLTGNEASKVLGNDEALERMPPNGRQRYVWPIFFGEAQDSLCTVSWHFQGEPERETRATLRG